MSKTFQLSPEKFSEFQLLQKKERDEGEICGKDWPNLDSIQIIQTYVISISIQY